MKKLTFWKSLFLLCALIVGSSSVWADTAGFTLSGMPGTQSASSGTITGTENWSWNLVPNSGKNAYSNSSGSIWQIGSQSNPATSLTLSTSGVSGTITKIVVSCASYQGKGSISATVGGNAFGTQNQTLPTWSNSQTSNITFTGSASGEIIITMTNGTSGQRAMYLYKVEVTYTPSGGGSTPSSEATFTTKEPSISYPATKTYSQVPTTAAGYSGTITYEITANTAGATINPSSGLVTVTKGGSVTVKATAEAVSGSFTSSSDTYTLTVNDTRASAGLAWSAESADVQYGADDNIFPTLTNTHNVDVKYTSSNQAAATIDANGVITLKDYNGNTTISAIFDGDDDYKDQTVTYTLNVTKAPFAIKDGIFDFVEAGSQNPLVDYGSGIELENDNQSYVYTNSTWTAVNVTMVASGKYRWWYNGNELRFYNNDPQSKFTLSVPTGYVITKVVFNGGSNFSVDSGVLSSTSSGTWTGAANSVIFTYAASSGSQNVKSLTVTYTTANQTFTPAKTYTTLTSAYALDFTNVSGLKAFIAKDEVSEGSVKMTQVNKVPANTGLVLKATTPNSAVNVPVFDGTGADDVTGNKMVGSATETTAIEKDGGYILSNGVFQPADAGTLAAGKAYLNIAVPAGARSLVMSFDDATTGIANLNVDDNFDANAPIYNLAGQRVNKSYKGVVIVNGKKMLNK